MRPLTLLGLPLALALLGAISPDPLASPAAFPANWTGSIDVPATATAPVIDGTLSDPLWKNAAVAHLTYDLRNHQRANDATSVYLLADSKYLYVGIDAKQSIPVRATEHTDGVGLDTDDEVQVDLWPNGTSGFRYKFTSTAIGTHYQYSTENNLFEPGWLTVGKIVPGGYTITERIPLAAMHGTGTGGWRCQFIRYNPVTNDQYVWSYGSQQQDFNSVNFSGTLAGLPRLAALKARPRIGVYGLGAIAAPSAGGSTSRMGADFSIPVIPGTAFVGTIHPDFSNVEIDQQTIAPTAFQRIFTEVRPFFAQGANFYNYPNGTCAGCPGILELYTPNIPTPRDGYAIEGQRGLFTYGAYDSVGAGRSDTAQAVNYVTPNQQTSLDVMRTSVNMPGFRDDLSGFVLEQTDNKNYLTYVRYANDSGTDVLQGDQAQRYEAGGGYYTPTASIFGAIRKIGAYFNPFDGLVQHPDIAGYNLNASKALKYAPTAAITEVDLSGNIDIYHGTLGGLNQTDQSIAVSVNTRTLFNFQATVGSDYLRLDNGLFSPVTQQGLAFGYNLQSAMPTAISFNTGRYGPGRLNSWARSSTIRVGPRGLFTLEVDDTDQFLDRGVRLTQWLERAGFAYQRSSNDSFAFGVRRIIGTTPDLDQLPCTASHFNACFQSGWNLSAAYHRRFRQGELYVVYGDANNFSTVPQFIVKFIKYLGAEKGT
jgi:hypothetical protein